MKKKTKASPRFIIIEVVVLYCSIPHIIETSYTSRVCLALLRKHLPTLVLYLIKISFQQDCHYEEERHRTLSEWVTEIMTLHPLSIFTIWKWISRCHIWASREWGDLWLGSRFYSSNLLLSLFPFRPESHLCSLGSVFKTKQKKG